MEAKETSPRSLVPGFLSSLVDSALRLPVAIERRLSRNEENRGGGETTNGREERSFGEFLRAVSTVSRKNSRREEEEEWEAGFTGEEREMEGLVDREALLALVTCSCGCFCHPPVAQCRKGHIFCRECWSANRRTCTRCKQTVVDSPNIALDRLMSLMALPCSNKGCLELLYLNKMESHLESCKFRLQSCPNKERGCKVRLQAKDICWHMKQCGLTGVPPPPARKLSIPKNTERRHSKGSANSLKVQLKEAEERRLSRSCSKSPGIRSQESPIQFPTVNPDQKTPELKIQDSTTLADNTSDPKTPELKISEPSGLGSGQLSPTPISLPEEKGMEDKNSDTDGTNEPQTKVQVTEKKPKPKPRRKPQ